MSQVQVCIQYNGVRHLGGLHYAELDFSVKNPDRSRAATGIIRAKSRRGLIPLIENNLDKMAEYLISRLKMPFDHKPHIFINFDSREILSNERITLSTIDLYKSSRELFSYDPVDQKTLDRRILDFTNVDRCMTMQAIKGRD